MVIILGAPRLRLFTVINTLFIDKTAQILRKKEFTY